MVATIHDVSREGQGQWMTNRFRRLFDIAETLLYRLPYQQIIAVSQSTADALVSRWHVDADRIRVVPNGISLPTGEDLAIEHPREIDLVFAGRFVPTKNIEDLIEVVSMCHDAGAARRALLIGDGPLFGAMVEKTRALGLSGVIEFCGRKTNAEVLELLRRAKVFFHASSREGFPVVMVEAMAHGLPVVAYRVPGVVDVIEHGATGLLVTERDTRALATACMKLLASSESRAVMTKNARRVVDESLTISKMADRILDAYAAGRS
jgi:glycosyltransferase involved in cell wall biosynthesis